jgi:YidC/Oxa1 family membrane protein insertase
MTSTGGWFGFPDRYWASALAPNANEKVEARFSASGPAERQDYQTDFVAPAVEAAPGATVSHQSRVFAGALEVPTLDAYAAQYNITKFDRLIDWGKLYFITKPMFFLIDFLYKYIGNFGLAILAVTVIVKAVFFPLANKSYRSMAKMKLIQPKLAALKAQYPDDQQKFQQAQMALMKTEGVNPVAGCLPVLPQIPVFISLYSVFSITLEMRHQPFYGWIHDLSVPDPTNVFTAFGLIPFDPTIIPVFGPFLHLGVWPLAMGLTMFLQMKMQPEPTDPTQKMMFMYMPVVFTFMFGSLPAGLVIYYAWNNLLTLLQQSIIMKSAGSRIELFDNLRNMFRRKPA